MRRRSSRPLRERGFTLMEMMVVMILLGVIAGLGFAGFDSMDPGRRGLQISLETFLEASRDRARGSGQDVRVWVAPPDGERGARLVRAVYRRALEAGFEARFERAENVHLEGGARLGGPGRSGAGLDLAEGGSARLDGRGGSPDVSRGFAVEFDLLDPDAAAGRICEWPGLLEIEATRGAAWRVRLRAGDSEFLSWVTLDLPAQFLRPGRWQRLRVAAAEGRVRVFVDGELAAEEAIGAELGRPSGAPRFGAAEDGFRGRVDEAVAWIRVHEEGPELSGDIEVRFGAPALLFDRNGMLDAAAHDDAVRVDLIEFGESLGSFLVGRFTQEAAP